MQFGIGLCYQTNAQTISGLELTEDMDCGRFTDKGGGFGFRLSVLDAKCFRLRGTMMRRFMVAVAIGVLLPCYAIGQGTKLWSVDRYDGLEKGSSEGVAIRSDGRLAAGPETSLLYATGGSYVWSVASDGRGTAYVGMGGTASGSAVMMRVTISNEGSGTARDDNATKVFEGKELAVQALRVATDGSVLAATSPDGKVYRIANGAKAGAAATVIFDSAMTEEKPKYLWDLAVGKGGEVYVATGAPAAVYRVPASGGKAEVLFKTGDQHIRCLLLGPDGTLWAGSDGAGVIYKFETWRAGAQPFAVYAATRKEITALAMDPAGNVFASGVGAKGGMTLPPLQVTGAVGVTLTFTQPGSALAAGANALVPEGSEIYRIGVDGAPARLLTLKDDVVYALAVRNGSLLAATGNRGTVYRIDTDGSGRFTDLAHLEASQGMAFAAVDGGLLVGTSNSGKVFRLEDVAVKDATYTSEVFDAQGFAQWGRAEVRAEGLKDVDLYVRTGNVPRPLMGWSDWARVNAEGAVAVPGARFAQWKAVLRAAGSVDAVGLNYLPKNVAPVVDEIVVQAGARIVANQAVTANATVQVSFPAASSAVPVINFAPDANATPLAAQKDKFAITVRWLAHDENGDDLMFAVWYRGVGETNWRLLKNKISDRYLSFDSGLLPDGIYELKVVASDSPVHTDADALVGERVSEVFVVDTTPPVLGALVAEMSGGKIHARLEARDAVSPISRAEYSVDAGEWQYVEPVGKVSDSLMERYDFLATVPTVTLPITDAKEHLIAVRVYDRLDNAVTVKAVVK